MAHSSVGVSGVGHHHHLGRAGEGGGDPDRPRHLALGLGHVAVAGTDDDVDGLDRLGAVGHGRDGLGPAHPVHLVDPGQGGGGQRGVVDPAVGTRRHAQRDLAHAGHPGGRGRHQDGRRVAGPSPGGVAPGPSDRSHQVAHGDATRPVLRHRCGRLVAVVGGDALVGHLEGVAAEGRGCVGGRPAVRLGHPQLVDLGTVEDPGQTPEGGVAVPPHLGDDVGHLDGRTVLDVDRSGQLASQRAGVGGPAAKVEPPESHCLAMVPERLSPASRARVMTARWPSPSIGRRAGAMLGRWPPLPPSCLPLPPPSTNSPIGSPTTPRQPTRTRMRRWRVSCSPSNVR